jgi:hypothetical protein
MHDQLDRFGAGYRICLASMRRLVARAALRGSSSKAGGRYRCPLPPCRRPVVAASLHGFYFNFNYLT